MFPSAYDGVVHFNLQLLEGITLPNFLAIRKEGRSLLNVAYVFSDLHKKVCFRCGQLAHLGQYYRAEVQPIADQGPVWSFLDVPALRPQPSLGVIERPPAEESASTQVDWSASPRALEDVDGSRAADGGREIEDEGLGERASPGGSLEPLPLGHGSGESEQSAEPALGSERVVREPASEQGPPFRVFSGRGSEEVASVALSLPWEPFLYLSPDSLPQGVDPFPGVVSQDTLSSPFLSDSVLRVEQVTGSQVSLASLASEAETVSGTESDGAGGVP
jgi:hypothetical protein